MSGQIFISYRRGDTSYPAAHLYERLSTHFAQNQIFMDIDNLEPGVDFVEAIQKSVSSCDVLIAVIGKRWLGAADEEGKRRLDNPEDFVRTEIGTALKRGIRVIPVLVEGASMPRAAELPDDLKALVRRQALPVSPERFRDDSGRLIGAVERALEDARVELQRKREEQERVEVERHEHEEKKGQLATKCRETEAREHSEAERQVPRQNEPATLGGIDASSSAPPSSRTFPREGTANLKKPWRVRIEIGTWRLLVVIGSGVAVVLLSFSLYFGTRSMAPPGPTPSGAGWFAEAKRYLDTKDYAQALPLLQKAADAGNVTALRSLGLLYQNGQGVAQDYAQARQWFQKAADAGNTDAMTDLGYLYEKGRGVAQDYAQARQWYQKAAEAGNADAMYRLGSLYENGQGVARDYAQARQWYQKAADAGSAGAKAALSRLPSAPNPSPSGADWLGEAKRYLTAKDYAQALPPLRKAAAVGNAEAAFHLGVLYQAGQGVAQDYTEARRWYQKAAEAGNVSAMLNLGVMYETGGRGVAQDYAQAREWYQKAAEAGYSGGMYRLGLLYRYGEGVTQDYAQARQWFQKAADAGDADAKQALSQLPSK